MGERGWEEGIGGIIIGGDAFVQDRGGGGLQQLAIDGGEASSVC